MADYAISYADISGIERNLRDIWREVDIVERGIDSIDHTVDMLNNNVKIIEDNVGKLSREFYDYVEKQMRANYKAESNSRIIQIRQELEKKYGHYDFVRRTTTGILQADDLAIVKKDTISTATEELMISTPGYWLAPCLVALAAWINDDKDLAERAVREGIKRDDEKSSLFWALICRRAERKNTSLKWIQRYMQTQDAQNLDRKTVIILDAYVSGLLGTDSEGLISKQIGDWLDHLVSKPGFVEQQTKQWSDAINLKRKPFETDNYSNLKRYSTTWKALEEIMEVAMLHEDILKYFKEIFEQEFSTDSLKAQLDDILNNLVTGFDEEEAPLRKEELYHQLVVDFDGDKGRAKSYMLTEQNVFEERKDFTQLLTDISMKPKGSNASVSTQKFAIALSKEWITNAYNEIVEENRKKIPDEIEINVEDFKAKTTDGQNEKEIMDRFDKHINNQKENALQLALLTSFERFCLYGGGAIAFLGLLMWSTFMGFVCIIAGIGMVINHFSKKKKIENERINIESMYSKKLELGRTIIRSTIAEIVDFREEFAKKDGESQKVIDFLEQIRPEQYVNKLSDANRKIKIS